MDAVVAPVLQTPPTFPESMTLPPAQNVVAPLAVIVDAIGNPLLIILLCKSIAPVHARALPESAAASNMWIAPLEIIVPIKTDPSPKVTAPFTCQYTLQKEAPLISVTVEFTVVAKAPSI